jgi:endonuclease YncB( thermonuclease family)
VAVALVGRDGVTVVMSGGDAPVASPAGDAEPRRQASNDRVGPPPGDADRRRQASHERRPPAVSWFVPAGARRAPALRVVDGDTLEIAGLGSSRLIGIDTPEVHGGRECFGPAASAHVERLVPPGTALRYVLGRDPEDRYGRALVTAWLPDGRAVNALLVARGYATTLTVPPNTRYAGRLAALERRARSQDLGLWGRCGASR